MINRLKQLAWRRALSRCGSRPAPDRIPLGRRGNEEQNYYYAVLTDMSSGRQFSFVGLNGDAVRLRDNIESGPVAIAEVIIPKLLEFNFKARLYLKGYEFNYASPILFELENILRVPWAKVALSELTQWGYNLRTIAVHDKNKVLKYIVEKAIQDPDERFNPLFTMSAMFKQRIIFHPDFSSRQKYYQYIFDALVDDGLIKKVEFSYKITPKAITALQAYEEETRRHKDAVSLQRWLGVFAFISAASAVAQAYFSYKG